MGSLLYILIGANCDPPVPPENGGVVGTDFSLGAEAVFSCNSNYEFKGKENDTLTKTCGRKGWGRVPKCVRK